MSCCLPCRKSRCIILNTDTKLYIPVVILSAEDNAKLLQRLNSGFERTINWNKYQFKVIIQTKNDYLYYLIDASFQKVNIYKMFCSINCK